MLLASDLKVARLSAVLLLALILIGGTEIPSTVGTANQPLRKCCCGRRHCLIRNSLGDITSGKAYMSGGLFCCLSPTKRVEACAV